MTESVDSSHAIHNVHGGRDRQLTCLLGHIWQRPVIYLTNWSATRSQSRKKLVSRDGGGTDICAYLG